MTIFQINNRFVKEKDAVVPITSDLLRGYGIFETIKTHNKKPIQLNEHIDRLCSSAKTIELPIKYTKSELKKMVEKVAKKSPHKTQRIKITAITGKIIIISTHQKIDKKIYKTGATLLSIKRERPIPEIKSISYISSFLSHEQATKKGAFEALLIDENNEVYECAYSNIFWFEGNTLCTREKNILPGITRDTIIKISPFKIKFKNIKLSELKKKKEIFITSSIIDIVPITKIDNTKIGTSLPGKNTKQLINLKKNTKYTPTAEASL